MLSGHYTTDIVRVIDTSSPISSSVVGAFTHGAMGHWIDPS